MAASSGSSPLARGLLGATREGQKVVRIIPARAGFTYHPIRNLRITADHPRSRGVYPSSGTWQFGRAGSSPLARGLLWSPSRAGTRLRIIPARAGFTLQFLQRERAGRDHPRSRGVYGRIIRASRIWIGSSPLARGLPVAAHHYPARRGIIPARAGFTFESWSMLATVQDHPRSRGVYSCHVLSSKSPAGSSPLARGLLNVVSGDHMALRIIPARAGFTVISVSMAVTRRDHPRSRGVYTLSTRAPA